jgi:uncharacterized protein (DUF362 family)
VIHVEGSDYCDQAPFDPSGEYPELPWSALRKGPNPAYDGVRQLFQALGYDAANFGSKSWNPLGWLIQPGHTVVLKPNLLKESHPRDPNGWRYVLTHGSFVRAVADYVCIALAGQGRIVVCDAPQTDSNFAQIGERLGLDRLAEFYRSKGVHFDLIDLRKEEWEDIDGAIIGRRELPGDPRGSVAYDLGARSELAGHAGSGHYYGADYDLVEVNAHHSQGRHEYLISKTVMEADVFINLPKLKTHKKTGITVALKNLVGINADKNWLPHHTEGEGSVGGDEFPELTTLRRLESAGSKVLRRLALISPRVGGRLLAGSRSLARPILGGSREVIRAGNWYGNDTAWRMCLDLNKILFFGRLDGTLMDNEVYAGKRYLALVDGILAGEGDGPLDPDPVAARLVLGGTNPAAVDAAAAVLMGFDPEKIPVVYRAYLSATFPLVGGSWRDVRLVSNAPGWNVRLGDIDPSGCFHFKPHFGWEGHIEREPAAVSRSTHD